MIDTRLRIRHLTCFLEVANARSVVKAADKLFITQPAVSKTIRELEEILCARLFNRSKRSVTLTPLGEVFQAHANASLATLREGVFKLTNTRGAGLQYVAVGVLPTVAARLMPPAVTAFRASGGRGSINLVTGPNDLLLGRLRVGELDLVVGRLGESDLMVGLGFEHLYAERLTVVVRPNHPITEHIEDFDVARIRVYPLILPSPNTVIRRDAERLLIAAGVWPLHDYVETFSATFARQYLVSTDAVWIASLGVVVNDLNSGMLRELPVDVATAEGPVGLTTRIDAVPSASTELMI